MTSTPEKLRDLASKEFIRGGLVEIDFIADAREALRQAADEIERFRSLKPNELITMGHKMAAKACAAAALQEKT